MLLEESCDWVCFCFILAAPEGLAPKIRLIKDPKAKDTMKYHRVNVAFEKPSGSPDDILVGANQGLPTNGKPPMLKGNQA
ncbi:hypothetical protein ES705_41743 [subsurface metagenome]